MPVQDLQSAYQKLCSTARQIARTSIGTRPLTTHPSGHPLTRYAEAKMAVDEDEYVGSFNPALMAVSFAW